MEDHNPYASPVAEAVSPTDQRQALAGRGFVYVCICAVLLIGISILVTMIPGRVNVIRLTLTSGLGLFMIMGHSWARWTTVVLLTIAVLMSLLAFALTLVWELAALMAVYGGIALTLSISPSVNAFFNPHPRRGAGSIHREYGGRRSGTRSGPGFEYLEDRKGSGG